MSNLKIKPEHFQYIKDKIAEQDTQARREQYRSRNFKNADKVKDLDKRYRWDLFCYAVPVKFVCDVLYKYLDDNHLDSALRQIVPELETANV